MNHPVPRIHNLLCEIQEKGMFPPVEQLQVGPLGAHINVGHCSWCVLHQGVAVCNCNVMVECKTPDGHGHIIVDKRMLRKAT